MFHTNFVEKIKTHILCSVTFFSFENRAVCEIMWKNFVDGDRPQMTIWRGRIAGCITKAKHTLRLCNTHCFSTATVVARTHLTVTLYVHCLSSCNITKSDYVHLLCLFRNPPFDFLVAVHCLCNLFFSICAFGRQEALNYFFFK